MKYISTRGASPPLEFEDVLMTGLASDGGLYVPSAWPQISDTTQKQLRGLPYAEVAFKIIQPFVGDAIPDKDLLKIVTKAYSSFKHTAVTPLTQLDSQLWLMELFHGPTLAFKDIALQLIGPLFDYVLEKRDEHITLVGATSGDTGAAAIAACRGRKNIDIFILHPRGRISDIQRKQMTTCQDSNVYNIGIDGSFDDCQEIVKSLFNDDVMKRQVHLGAINSINWARIMAQIVYYVYAAVNLGTPDRAVSFCVPTGNFGNIYAAYAAKQMGLPIAKLICASNGNDILTRFYETGIMKRDVVMPSLSPSMDIQVSSNFERLLFDLVDRKGGEVIRQLAMFRAAGFYALNPGQHRKYRNLFVGHRADDAATMAALGRCYKETGLMVDPHTAVGLAAAYNTRLDQQFPLVCLATAHPAKFPDAVLKSIGVRPMIPTALAAELSKAEQMTTMQKHYKTVADFILQRARRKV